MVHPRPGRSYSPEKPLQHSGSNVTVRMGTVIVTVRMGTLIVRVKLQKLFAARLELGSQWQTSIETTSQHAAARPWSRFSAVTGNQLFGASANVW